VDHGQLLLMPAEGRTPGGGTYAGVKIATVAPDNPGRGLPREPGAREVDGHTVRHATVVVESRAAATREAGDLIQVIDRGLLDPARLLPLADPVRHTPGSPAVDSGRPRLFRSVGMAWEDLVIAGAVHEATESGEAGEAGERAT
jgi:ornithine cyclodeaminase/alanine dehydrogenase-like protein (mu-crystallin family)